MSLVKHTLMLTGMKIYFRSCYLSMFSPMSTKALKISNIFVWYHNSRKLNLSGSTELRRLCATRNDSDQLWNIASYNQIADETLESLSEYFEEVLVTNCNETESDVTLGNGVLTVHFGSDKGTYVINKQTPNKQIWLSSPVSGPKRYQFINGRWIYRHDGCSLHELLNEEIGKMLNARVNFTACSFGKE